MQNIRTTKKLFKLNPATSESVIVSLNKVLIKQKNEGSKSNVYKHHRNGIMITVRIEKEVIFNWMQ